MRKYPVYINQWNLHFIKFSDLCIAKKEYRYPMIKYS